MDNQIYGLTKGQLSPTSRRGPGDGVVRARVDGEPGEPAAVRARLRRGVRGPGHAGRHERPGEDHRGGHPLPRVRLHQRAVAVRHLRAGRPAAQGAEGDDADARVAGPRSRRPPGRHGSRAGVRREAVHGRVLPAAGAGADVRARWPASARTPSGATRQEPRRRAERVQAEEASDGVSRPSRSGARASSGARGAGRGRPPTRCASTTRSSGTRCSQKNGTRHSTPSFAYTNSAQTWWAQWAVGYISIAIITAAGRHRPPRAAASASAASAPNTWPPSRTPVAARWTVRARDVPPAGVGKAAPRIREEQRRIRTTAIRVTCRPRLYSGTGVSAGVADPAGRAVTTRGGRPA